MSGSDEEPAAARISLNKTAASTPEMQCLKDCWQITHVLVEIVPKTRQPGERVADAAEDPDTIRLLTDMPPIILFMDDAAPNELMIAQQVLGKLVD